MSPSRKKHEERSVFDINAASRKRSFAKRFSALIYGKTLNLRPKFRVRHPWITVATALFLIGVAVIGLRRFFVRAEVVDFYPVSCLGTWQSPEKAQGEPESLAGNGLIDATSSAIWNTSSSQIFCGNFVPPNTDETGDIQNIGLTIAWNMTGLPTSTDVTPATSTDPSTSTPSSTLTTPTTPTPDGTSAQSLRSQFSPFSLLFPVARAQDASTADPGTTDTIDVPPPTPTDAPPLPPAPPAPPTDATDTTTNAAASTTEATPTDVATVSTDTATSSDIINTPPIAPPLTDTTGTATTTETVSTPTTPPVDATTSPSLPDDSFLLVSYSLDGNIWIPLQRISPANWQNLTVSLPIVHWADLEKLQIKIEGMPTTLSPLPTVLLDGMFVEVHYDLPSPFLEQNKNATTGPQIVQVGPNVTMEIPPPSEPVPMIAPKIVSLTKTGETVHVAVAFAGPFWGQPLEVFLYPEDTTATRAGVDQAFYFQDDLDGKPYLNAAAISEKQFDANHTFEWDIVGPGVDANHGVPSELMQPGNYVIDATYYNNGTWMFEPLANFSWP